MQVLHAWGCSVFSPEKLAELKLLVYNTQLLNEYWIKGELALRMIFGTFKVILQLSSAGF